MRVKHCGRLSARLSNSKGARHRMKYVSTTWQQEINNPNRRISVDGTLWLKGDDGLISHNIPEAAIVANSLTITDQLNSGKFGFGSVYLKNLSVKIDYTRCYDIEAKNINLTNAQIRFNFTLYYDDGTSETLRLENFLVDSTKSSRRGDILSIHAVSCMSSLDITSEAMTDATPYAIYKRACDLAQVLPMTTQSEFSSFPNYDKKFTFDTRQIQTARDMLMWVAELTCTNAFATVDYSSNPGGVWAVKLVQTPTKYTQGGTSLNFDLETFRADNGTIIPADIRYQSEFTDTSIRVTTISTQNQGETITEHRNWNFSPDTLEGSMEIKFNPLFEDKRSDESALQEWIYNTQRYVEQLRFCPFKTKFLGNPAIEVGDFVYLEAGGDIDETNFRHYGIVTFSKWIYPDTHEIRCATDLTAERPETASAIALMKANSPNVISRAAPIAAYANDNSTYGAQPKSQLEKRLDAMSGVSDRIVNGDRKLIIVPTATPAAISGENEVLVSVYNGIFQACTKSFRVNINPGAIYIEGGGSNAPYVKAELNHLGAEYTVRDPSRGDNTFRILFENPYGSGPGVSISAVNPTTGKQASLIICEDGLYFNNRKIAE